MVTLDLKPNGENKKLVNTLLFFLVLSLIVFISLQCVVISYLILQEIKM